ncbi:hypothetical protein JDV09_20485 [Mycobacterium sp. Y57]|uniref:hypothetical protein n=1 Tax=Mycolicibacterium xanthum TaxID=2796469 RepID=UPI001C851893|nr:hypothetical protein [Mycolicibacterium xanthum]MBX7434458.1 hypothetical protein [Mycolicibacterium xanthum]
MLFTGRPITAQEMYECDFVNKVVPRDQPEAEVATYSRVCARTRPTDSVHIQKTFFHVLEQFQGEYMGALITGLIESLGAQVKPDFELTGSVLTNGLTDSVKSNDEQFPPAFRLSKKGRAQP